MIFLVPLLATKEALTLPANEPIMLGRLILSYRQFELQNPSIISYSIGRARMVQQFPDQMNWIESGESEESEVLEEYS